MIKKIIAIIIIITGLYACKEVQQIKNIPNTSQKILFLGNSITYAGHYITYIESYIKLKYPNRKFEFINLGLSSETVSGLSEPSHAKGKFPRPDLRERLTRILDKTKPDLVLACYGMNDGIYLPLDEFRFDKFKEGIQWLHNEVNKTKTPIIHLTPPIYDERKGEAYAHVLDVYSDWILDCKKTKQWEVIDIHWPMQKYLETKRQTDTSFVFAKDGVHPNPLGHWVMAKQILLHWGFNDVEKFETSEAAFSSIRNGEQLLKLIEERQEIMKHAWLTYTGYNRPGIKEGLPFDEAREKYAQIENTIQKVLKKI